MSVHLQTEDWDQPCGQSINHAYVMEPQYNWTVGFRWTSWLCKLLHIKARRVTRLDFTRENNISSMLGTCLDSALYTSSLGWFSYVSFLVVSHNQGYGSFHCVLWVLLGKLLKLWVVLGTLASPKLTIGVKSEGDLFKKLFPLTL